MLNLGEEQELFKQGYKIVAGIDEAGRGPLAGPVVAACVIFSPDFDFSLSKLSFIKDSKQLNSRKREDFFSAIKDEASAVGIGVCDQFTIDRINILQASFLAMKKALGDLARKPDFILLDGGFPIPNLTLPQKAVVRGDEKIFSIAAASVIAKVTRDQIMREMHEIYPQYGFSQHKGYGTKFHLEKLREFGPCPLHRKSFAPVREILNVKQGNNGRGVELK